MSPMLATFLFEIVNFLLLALLLGWLLFKPVRSALAERVAAGRQREEEIAGRASETDRQRAELAQRRQDFERDIADTRERRLAAVEEEAQAVIVRAREAAQRETDGVARSLARLERAQVERLATAVAAIATESVGRLLATINGPDLETALIQAACRQLAKLPLDAGVAVIESARPLDETTRTAVAAMFASNGSNAEFRVTTELGAGLRVTTSHGLIDTSVLGVAHQAERRITEALAAPIWVAT